MSSEGIRVAYQGEPGAFSEEAVRQLLAAPFKTLACRTFPEVFEAVTTGQADAAVAPIENTLAGSVYENYDLLLEHNLTIVGEINLRIVHNLIAPVPLPMNQIKRAYSHPVALAQCERFFRANPQIEKVPAHDTAGSVRLVMESGEGAAIAGDAAARTYGASIIARGIEDNSNNFTRFLLLTPPERAQGVPSRSAGTGRKTSIVFRVPDRPGALFRSLAAFALRDVNLCKIESRPIEGRPWEYTFYLDISGDSTDATVLRALSHLSEMTETIRVLGSYPCAPTSVPQSIAGEKPL